MWILNKVIICLPLAIVQNQVLIDVKATSINPIEQAIRSGSVDYGFENPGVIASDFAGQVVEVGSDVTDVKVNDRVAVTTLMKDGGGLGEFAAVDAQYVVPITENLSYKEAAGLGLASLTAYQLVNDPEFKVKEGDRVFVQGGSGGVGHFVVQFAKANGGYLAATTSQSESLLSELGVDDVINYKETDPVSHAKDRYDALIDTAGRGTETLDVVVDGGRAITPAPAIDEEVAAKRNIKTKRLIYENRPEEFAQIVKDAMNGDLKVVIDQTFPLTAQGVSDAYKELKDGHGAGKIIIEQ